MNENTITYGSIEPRVGVQSVAKLLKVGLPKLVTQRFAQMGDAQRRKGGTIRWRRYHAFTVSAAPLAEGVTPARQPLTKTDYTAILRQYAGVSELTDVCFELHEDNPLAVCITHSGNQFAQTIETVTINTIKAGTNVYYASNVASRGAVVAAATRADLRLIARGFDRNDAQPIGQIIPPSPKVSTMGVHEAFFAMGHTDLEPDITNIVGFKAYIEYGDPGKRIDGEIGAVDRFRFVLTRMFTAWLAEGGSSSTLLANGNIPSGSTSCDVYPIIIVAQDAYGCVRLQGRKAVDLKVRQPDGAPTDTDPISQRGTVGWKTWFACAILNEPWIARLEVGCTANPA